jgi:hypothetical protein
MAPTRHCGKWRSIVRLDRPMTAMKPKPPPAPQTAGRAGNPAIGWTMPPRVDPADDAGSTARWCQTARRSASARGYFSPPTRCDQSGKLRPSSAFRGDAAPACSASVDALAVAHDGGVASPCAQGDFAAERRRSWLSRTSGVRSSAGRISKGPTLTPGCFDISWTAWFRSGPPGSGSLPAAPSSRRRGRR